MPKVEPSLVPRHPTAGPSLTSVDEAMVLDLSCLPSQIKGVLDAHCTALEKKVSKVVCASEGRLLEHIGSLLEHIESLRSEACFGQSLPGIMAGLPVKQEVVLEAEQEPEREMTGPTDLSHVKAVSVDRGVVLVDDDAGHETWRRDALHGLLSNTQGHLPRKLAEPKSTSSPLPPPAAEDRDHSRGAKASLDKSTTMKSRTKSVRGSLASTDTHGSTYTTEDTKILKSMKVQAETMMKIHSAFLAGDHAYTYTPIERMKWWTEFVASLVLVANVVWMGFATELSMHHVMRNERAPAYLNQVEVFFLVAMIIEVVVKLVLYRWEFFIGPAHRWNLFDVVLIMLAGGDLLLNAANLTFVRVLRGLRAIRATRILRTLTWVPELRLIFSSVTASAASLIWSFLLMGLVLFLWALGLQQTVHSALETGGLEGQHPELLKFYGSIGHTMLSLFMAISGGTDWKTLSDPLSHISQAYVIVYIIFIILIVFGLLNILTAIFVEKTSNIADVDPDLVIQNRLKSEAASVAELLLVLCEADTDESGMITKEELEGKLHDPRFRAHMQMLDLNILEVQGVFQLLDVDRVGAIDIEELVFGLIRMKGNARAMDMNTMLYDTKRMLTMLTAFDRSNEMRFKAVEHHVHSFNALLKDELKLIADSVAPRALAIDSAELARHLAAAFGAAAKASVGKVAEPAARAGAAPAAGTCADISIGAVARPATGVPGRPPAAATAAAGAAATPAAGSAAEPVVGEALEPAEGAAAGPTTGAAAEPGAAAERCDGPSAGAAAGPFAGAAAALDGCADALGLRGPEADAAERSALDGRPGVVPPTVRRSGASHDQVWRSQPADDPFRI